MKFTVNVKDHFGRWYDTGVRYTDKARALATVRSIRLELGKTGAYVTGAIPGYGVAVDVRLGRVE